MARVFPTRRPPHLPGGDRRRQQAGHKEIGRAKICGARINWDHHHSQAEISLRRQMRTPMDWSSGDNRLSPTYDYADRTESDALLYGTEEDKETSRASLPAYLSTQPRTSKMIRILLSANTANGNAAVGTHSAPGWATQEFQRRAEPPNGAGPRTKRCHRRREAYLRPQTKRKIPAYPC